MKDIRKLLVLGRVTHYRYGGRLYAYTPYAREIDIWAELFPEVIIASTCHDGPPQGDCSPFAAKNITLVPVAEAGGHGFKAKFRQALVLPKIIWQIVRPMWRADAIHVRCPSDLGLLGIILGPLFSRSLVAKYATQWQPFGSEPKFWRMQRRLLKSRWWRGPVTVYGNWPKQPSQVIPFFTSMLTGEQVERARRAALNRKPSDVLRVLFVGRLTASKNVDTLLKAVAAAEAPNRRIECKIVGEGPQRAALEKLATDLGCRDRVTFTGGLPFDEVLAQYEQANALVLASKIEGWPKAIAEAMAFGLVCVGSERGMIPQMLAEGRGLLVPARDVKALRSALEHVAIHREEAVRMGELAGLWARRFSLEGLQKALGQLLTEHWGTTLVLPPTPTQGNQPLPI